MVKFMKVYCIFCIMSRKASVIQTTMNQWIVWHGNAERNLQYMKQRRVYDMAYCTTRIGPTSVLHYSYRTFDSFQTEEKKKAFQWQQLFEDTEDNSAQCNGAMHIAARHNASTALNKSCTNEPRMLIIKALAVIFCNPLSWVMMPKVQT